MAFIRNTDKFVEGSSNKFFSDGRAQLALQPTVTSLENEDSGMKLRLDVIEGGAGVEGSIAKAQADAQSYADQQIAALVNSAPEVLDTLKELSDAIGGDQNFAATVSGQIGAVDAKVDQEVIDRQAAVSGLESSVNASISSLQSADSALSLRLDQLELDPVTKSYVDSQDSSESSARQSADSALSGRLDTLEQDPTTKTYVDGEVSGLQGQITQEISDRQSGDSALSGRLDTIEGPDTVEGSIAKAEKDAQGYTDMKFSQAQSARAAGDSALSARLNTLEADPTTKTYVDSQDSGLQSQIDTEKGRIDAILSASEADKDSFAEIVNLINSVDTENDSAFAGYVSSNDAALAQEVSDRQAGDSTLQSNLDAEEAARISADSGLSGRLDVLEADPTTKTYVDSADSGLQSQITQEISDRQSGDSALSGRLDVLESDPVTKTYVDGLDSAMDSRMDVLEAAEPGLMKVDGTRAMTGDLSLPINGSIRFGGGFQGVVFSGVSPTSAQTQIKQQKFAAQNFTVSGPFQTSNDIALCSVTSAPIVVFLPNATFMNGRMIKVKAIGNDSTNHVRIQGSSGQLIDGQPDFILEVDGEAVMLFCQNNQWYVM